MEEIKLYTLFNRVVQDEYSVLASSKAEAYRYIKDRIRNTQHPFQHSRLLEDYYFWNDLPPNWEWEEVTVIGEVIFRNYS